MMKRRYFLTALGISVPALAVLPSCIEKQKTDGKDINIKHLAPLMAMLAMQRASWEQGVAMHAVSELGMNDLLVQMAHEACLRSHEDGRLGMQGSGNNVTDPVSNGLGVLQAYKITDDVTYKQAAEKLLHYCLNVAPKAPNGALYHLVNSSEVWSDSIYMAPPFLASMGNFSEAIRQLNAYKEYLWDKDKQLYRHRYNCETGKFVNEKFWGGGNGWAIAAYAMIIDMLPEEMMMEREQLIDHFVLLMEGMKQHLRADGLFHDILDDTNSFIETNVSQMFAYALCKGIKSGWVGNRNLELAEKMRNAANAKLDNYGLVQGACSSPAFDRPGTSTEAQAFYLLMENAFKQLNS